MLKFMDILVVIATVLVTGLVQPCGFGPNAILFLISINCIQIINLEPSINFCNQHLQGVSLTNLKLGYRYEIEDLI